LLNVVPKKLMRKYDYTFTTTISLTLLFAKHHTKYFDEKI